MISLRKQYPDGTLPKLERSGLHDFNNIMIIKVPDHLLQPGDLKFQLATLDPTKEDSSWPADEIVKKLIPEYPMKVRKKQIIEQNSDSEEEVQNSVVANGEKHNLANKEKYNFVKEEKHDSPGTRIHEKKFKNESKSKSFKSKGNYEYKAPGQMRRYRPRQDRQNNHQSSNINLNEWKNYSAHRHDDLIRRQSYQQPSNLNQIERPCNSIHRQGNLNHRQINQQPSNINLIERPSNTVYREGNLMHRQINQQRPNADLIEPWLPNPMPINTEHTNFPAPMQHFNQPYNGSPLPTNQHLGLLGSCPNDRAFENMQVNMYPLGNNSFNKCPELQAACFQPCAPNPDILVQSTNHYYEDNVQSYQHNISHDMTQGPQNNSKQNYSHGMIQGSQNNNKPNYSLGLNQGPQNNNQPNYSHGMIAQEPESKINYSNNNGGWMQNKYGRNGYAYRRNNKNYRRPYRSRRQ